MKSSNFPSDIRLITLLPKPKQSVFAKFITFLLDRVMAVSKLNRLYRNSELPGLDKQSFGESMLNMMDIDVLGTEKLSKKLPKTGSAVLVSNHPFGCIEGVALATELNKLRPDVKVLANKALSLFSELKDNFIFINPLNPNAPENATAIKECKAHLKAGGVLLIFPAGKVSYYHPEKQRVCDDEWNRLPGHLARATDSPVLPMFVEGQNSKLFLQLGRVYFRFKLLLLFREMLAHQGKPINVQVGNLLSTNLLSKFKSDKAVTSYLRLQSYLLQQQYRPKWPADKVTNLKPLAEPVSKELLKQEISQLDESQHLFDYKYFSVYFGFQHQFPNIVKDIARLRELVFRQHNEGSGEPLDTDAFDATYTHLFIFDNENGEIIGAYRMGQTDKLLAQGGVDALYLSRMFSFSENFVNRQKPCLEMGRSFIAPEHQRSIYGLFLLWRGIGEFAVRHPQYRTLYGTVSISKLYSPLSVECINQLALEPDVNAQAKTPFNINVNPELSEFIQAHSEHKDLLSTLVKGIECDGKDLPILMKHYGKMAARFYCIGIDKNFNDTPGLLLSVHLPSAPQKSLKQYLADGLESYLNYEK